MIIADFNLLDDLSIDTSFFKRDYMKIYHQQGAQLKNSDQSIDFFIGKETTIIK